jgi:hypothetical protein
MAQDGDLRERIKRALRGELRLRTDLQKAELERRLAAAAEVAAELGKKIKAGLVRYQPPTFGFAASEAASGVPEAPEAGTAEASNNPQPQPFAWGTFGEGRRKAWVEPDRAHAVRLVGRRETEAQLQEIARGAQIMIKALDSLQMPGIAALANRGLAREEVRPILARWDETIKSILAEGLDYVPENQGQGRPAQTERELTAALAEAYFDLTGERPQPRAEKHGSLFAVTAAVFEEIGIEKPETLKSMVRAAAERLAKTSQI